MDIAVVLAYHRDDDVVRSRDEWLAGLAILLAAASILSLRRLAGAREPGANWRSRIALALAVLLAPVAGLAPLLFVLPHLFLLPLTSLGLAAAGVVRRPRREPALAFAGLTAAGSLNVWTMSYAAACFATDGCFH